MFNTTWPGFNQVELDSHGDGRPDLVNGPDGLARKWDGMLQQLSALARLGNPGCRSRLWLAARNLDTSWVNPICDALGQPRGSGDEPAMGVSSQLGLSGGLIGEDGE
eukprot:391741-Alexandrium_andersonii.AAC.1